MTENEENHHTHHDSATSSKFFNPAIILGTSILLSAILLSSSIVYGSLYLAKNLSVGIAGGQQNVAAAQGQAAAPAPAGAAVTVADRSGEPVLGNKNAKVTVEEFGDFQCPYCKQFYQDTFGKIKSTYIDTGKIKYVFRYFPLTQIHVNAQISAEAAECANQQGKFWDYHNLLYTNGQADGTGLDKASLEKYATSLGLNNGTLGFGKNKFNQC